MPHNAVVVEHKILSDGALAVKHRCCDDPNTDSFSTIYITPSTTAEDLDKHVADGKARVEAQHAALLTAQDYVKKLQTNNQPAPSVQPGQKS